MNNASVIQRQDYTVDRLTQLGSNPDVNSVISVVQDDVRAIINTPEATASLSKIIALYSQKSTDILAATQTLSQPTNFNIHTTAINGVITLPILFNETAVTPTNCGYKIYTTTEQQCAVKPILRPVVKKRPPINKSLDANTFNTIWSIYKKIIDTSYYNSLAIRRLFQQDVNRVVRGVNANLTDEDIFPYFDYDPNKVRLDSKEGKNITGNCLDHAYWTIAYLKQLGIEAFPIGYKIPNVLGSFRQNGKINNWRNAMNALEYTHMAVGIIGEDNGEYTLMRLEMGVGDEQIRNSGKERYSIIKGWNLDALYEERAFPWNKDSKKFHWSKFPMYPLQPESNGMNAFADPFVTIAPEDIAEMSRRSMGSLNKCVIENESQDYTLKLEIDLTEMYLVVYSSDFNQISHLVHTSKDDDGTTAFHPHTLASTTTNRNRYTFSNKLHTISYPLQYFFENPEAEVQLFKQGKGFSLNAMKAFEHLCEDLEGLFNIPEDLKLFLISKYGRTLNNVDFTYPYV